MNSNAPAGSDEPFLIFAGGSRSGSNAVYYYLDQHPQTCMTRKTEIHFFPYPCMAPDVNGPGDALELAEVPSTFEGFLDSFEAYEPGQLRVNISPSLLFHYRCAERITEYLTNARLVFLLRNPIDKAYSHFLHMSEEGRERLSFEEALAREDERAELGFSDGFLYKRNGLYTEALQHFHKIFGDRMKIFLLDDFVADPMEVLKELCDFAGIDSTFGFERIGQVNRSGVQRYPRLGSLLGPNRLMYVLRRIIPPVLGRRIRSAIRNWNTGAKPPMSPEARQIIHDFVADDVRKLEDWLGRDTGWL